MLSSLNKLSSQQSFNLYAEDLRRHQLACTRVPLPIKNMFGLKVQIMLNGRNQPIDEKIHSLYHAARIISLKLPNAFSHVPTVNVYLWREKIFPDPAIVCWEPPNRYGHPSLFLAQQIFPPRNDFQPIQEMSVLYQIFYDTCHSKSWRSRCLENLFNVEPHLTTRGHALARAWIVHELGRIIYAYHPNSSKIFWEKRHPGEFWRENRSNADRTHQPMRPELSSQVSIFAGRSSEEFVIEVFTGLVHGKTYSESVLSTYKDLRGPRVIGYNWNDLI